MMESTSPVGLVVAEPRAEDVVRRNDAFERDWMISCGAAE